jgi:hypothetical protein
MQLTDTAQDVLTDLNNQLAASQVDSQRQILAAQTDAQKQMLAAQADAQKQMLATQVARAHELSEFSVCILKDTLNHAANTYKTITMMTKTTFLVGVVLFVVAAFWGALSQEKIYSLLFGGLGTASFLAFFLTDPITKTQIALSNLVQAEIAFMNYFEQMTFWEAAGLAQKGDPPSLDPANIEKASSELQKRTEETMELLETYLEFAKNHRSLGDSNRKSAKSPVPSAVAAPGSAVLPRSQDGGDSGPDR